MTPEVRGYFELAESVHPGPLRLYAVDLAAYLGEVLALVGTDEYVCRVCGVPNVERDGQRLHGTWFIWHDAAFCEAHHDAFEAYATAHNATVGK